MSGLIRAAELLGKAARKPPHVVVDRALYELKRRWEAYTIPRSGSGIDLSDVLRDVGAGTLADLLALLAARPYVAAGDLTPGALERLEEGEVDRLRDRAEAALGHRVNLLGSGPIDLGADIDWHRDYKSGRRWEPGFYGGIRYGDPASASDVKVPWEISRLQWLMPAAQMYVLTRDERYARAVRAVLESWIAQNPYGGSVNWTCTMEVALRVLSWSFLHRALSTSHAWSDPAFQERFIVALYEHGHFTDGHLEFSDVNGNHYTADAAGLVFAGLFFGGSGRSARWASRGWRILEAELPRQVTVDGVDFEASVPYHRLVLELFLLPALYRERAALPVRMEYRDRLVRMARYTAAYVQPDGLVPTVGDADDARALPFGTQPLNDHRYLLGIVGACWNVADLTRQASGSRAEAAWLLGAEPAARLPAAATSPAPASVAFPDAGYFVMRHGGDHVFIDCAPVGLAGRGGHGHNDCLSFTAMLDGVPLVVDCGAYVYTASYAERNRFRSTAVHNTPQVNGEEINRFISPTHLWNLHYDAIPAVRRFEVQAGHDVFVGSHEGYRRLEPPVVPVRTLVLDKLRGGLLVRDVLEGAAEHHVSTPWHLHPGVTASVVGEGTLELAAGSRKFRVDWRGVGWNVVLEPARYSPSYGVVQETTRIVWRSDRAGSPLTVLLRAADEGADADDHLSDLWMRANLPPAAPAETIPT